MHQQLGQGQQALQHLLAVDHKYLVGVIRQVLESAQIAQHHLQGDIVSDGDHLKIHAGPNAVLRVGHGRPQLLALLDGQALLNPFHHFSRQLIGQGREVIGVECLGHSNEGLTGHALDDAGPHGLPELHHDIGMQRIWHQRPNQHPLLQRQALQNISHIGRMQGPNLGRERSQLLLGHQLLHQALASIIARKLLAMHKLCLHPKPVQQGLNLLEGVRPRLGVSHLQAPVHAACSSRPRSCSSTGPVSGRRPRQAEKLSAACSTSMPRPSATSGAPASRAA